MSSRFGVLCRRAAVAGLAWVGSCSILTGNNYSVGFVGFDFAAYTVGDTVRVEAQELYETMNDKDLVLSSQSPALFTWTSSAPNKVEVSAPGVFVMKAPGNSTIGVRTSHDVFEIPVSVLPSGATFRLLPRDTTVSVGGRVTTALRIFDAQGAPVAVTPRASDVFFLLRGNVPENELPPTLPPILVQDLNTYTFRTNRAGRVEMVAILHVHGRPDLRDSTFVTAR